MKISKLMIAALALLVVAPAFGAELPMGDISGQAKSCCLRQKAQIQSDAAGDRGNGGKSSDNGIAR